MTKRMTIMHSYIAALHEGTEMRKEKRKKKKLFERVMPNSRLLPTKFSSIF